MGEWVTSCGVSCVCKLDGVENDGRVKPKGRYIYFHFIRCSVNFDSASNARLFNLENIYSENAAIFYPTITV